MKKNVEKHIDTLKKRGYRVEQAQGPDYDEDDNEIVYNDAEGNPVPNPPVVMYVEQPHPNEGMPPIFGLHVKLDDKEAWERLANQDAHEFRLDLAKADDPNDSFTLSEGEKYERSLQIQEKLGDITSEGAKSLMVAWQEQGGGK